MTKYILTVLFVIMFNFNSYAQTVITDRNYDSAVNQQGVVIVELWASWNSDNAYKILNQIRGAKVYRIDIELVPSLLEDYDIQAVPTLLYYKNGQLIDIDESDVSFKGKYDITHIQEHVDQMNK